MEILEFIFRDFTTWLGTLFLLYPIAWAIANIRLFTIENHVAPTPPKEGEE